MNILEYWEYTDLLTKLLFFILIIMSVSSWVVGILRYISSKKMVTGVDQIIKQRAESLPVVGLSISEKKQYAEQAMLQELDKLHIQCENGLSVLGTTAAIAPFIGLFGTVWGIYHALNAIGKSGEAGLGQVAGPVGEALIMTGLGLAVAIPAVIFYNICVRVNRRAIISAQTYAHDAIMNQFKP